jgi:hypothetical protein
MKFSTILIMAVLTEAVITYAKTFVVDRKIKWQMIAAVILSVVVCIAYSLDIPALIGIEGTVPYVGNIIKGILVSRGSNYIYDLFGLLKGKKSEVYI